MIYYTRKYDRGTSIMKNNANTENSYTVPAFERGLKLIELLGGAPDGLTIPEMESLDIPSASLFRLLSTLQKNGYAVREKGNIYRLTGKMLKSIQSGFESSRLIPCAIPSMRELRDITGETAMLAVLHGNEGVVLHQEPSRLPVKVVLDTGHNFPLHSAAPAKAIMAFLPETELSSLLSGMTFTGFTSATITTPEKFRQELELVKKDNIAFDRGEELSDLRCVSSAIINRDNYPCAAVWISGPASRLTDEKMEMFAPAVKAAAESISGKLK